nr:MAG TPA: hypothetical protein [Caudoviricetes sp.]
MTKSIFNTTGQACSLLTTPDSCMAKRPEE